jgi:hypothetical protein
MVFMIRDDDVKVRRPYAPAVRLIQSKRLYSRKKALDGDSNADS